MELILRHYGYHRFTKNPQNVCTLQSQTQPKREKQNDLNKIYKKFIINKWHKTIKM